MQKTFRNGFEAFKAYRSISRHVTTEKYDAIKYNFKTVTGKGQSEDNYPEKHIFERIAKRFSPSEWVILFGRNCIESEWVRDFAGDTGEDRFRVSMGFIENSQASFSSMFMSYLIMLHNRRIKYVDSINGDTPLILQEFLAGRVTAEFVILLDAATPFLHRIDSLIYKDLALRLRKYSKLFEINDVLLKDAIKSTCS